MVRTDSREQKLDAFVVPQSLASQDEAQTRSSSGTGIGMSSGEEGAGIEGGGQRKRPTAGGMEPPAARRRRQHKVVQLTSVQNLQREVRKREHKGEWRRGRGRRRRRRGRRRRRSYRDAHLFCFIVQQIWHLSSRTSNLLAVWIRQEYLCNIR